MKMKTLLKLSFWLAFSIGTALILRIGLIAQDLNGTTILPLGIASLNLEYTINTGINFGLAGAATSSRQFLLAGLALVLSLAIIIWGARSDTKWATTIAGLFAGGGLANAFERVYYGGVFDYLNVSFIFYDNPFSFNLSDIYIFLGLILFVIRPDESSKKI